MNEEKINKLRNIIQIGWLLFIRDFQYRYKRTFFGYGWAFLKPLLTILPIIMVGKQFKFGGDAQQGQGYVLFAFVGLILWQVFWDSVVMPQWFMNRVRKIVKEIPFPHGSIIVASCFYVLFNLLVYFAQLILTFFIYKAKIHLSILLALISIPLIIISGLAIGVSIAAITLVYLDFRYGLLPLFSNVLLWCTPIAYALPEKGLLHKLNIYNPLTYLIGIPRSWFINGFTGSDWLFIPNIIIFVSIFLLSFKFYKKTVPIVIDQII